VNHLNSFFPDPKGTRLRYQYWEDSSKGYNRVALILHGLGRDSGSYPSLVPALVEARYKVYAFDFAGFGSSPGERGAGGTVAMADAVESLCRRIESTEGAREIDLVAHSMGAVAALLFLKRYPARRARLAALAPLLFGAPMDARLEAFSEAEAAGGLAEKAFNAAIPNAFAADLDAAAKALVSDPSFLEGRKAAFFVGESDPLVPLARIREEKRLVSFPRERHDPLAGKRAAEVAKAMIAWFDETRFEHPAP
jgi:alpha-beta hydrolase superfamily lysophospholipase